MENELMKQDGFTVATNEQSFSALIRFGEQLVKTGFLPQAIKTGAQAASIILTGREIGLQPMTALRLISVVNGKPTLAAELQLGLFVKRGGHVRWTESTNEKAVLELVSPSGDKHIETFTIADAKTAGLASKPVWQQYPKMMLRARCATGGLRAIDPGNNLYDPEEIGGVPVLPNGEVMAEFQEPVVIQRGGGVTEERDPGAPPRAKQPFPKAEDPLVVKVNETETFNDIMALRAKWEKADKSKYSEDRIALIDKAIEGRILALTPAEEPNESAESLEIALNEPEPPIPTTFDEWRELICGTMTVAGLESVERLVQNHVILNGKMKGAEKKPITDCLKTQKEAIGE